MKCNAVVNLDTPVRSERVRGFQPPWRTVFIYRCPACKREIRVRANGSNGGRPSIGPGAILCGGEA